MTLARKKFISLDDTPVFDALTPILKLIRNT